MDEDRWDRIHDGRKRTENKKEERREDNELR
jgi:hypothetical protein